MNDLIKVELGHASDLDNLFIDIPGGVSISYWHNRAGTVMEVEIANALTGRPVQCGNIRRDIAILYSDAPPETSGKG